MEVVLSHPRPLVLAALGLLGVAPAAAAAPNAVEFQLAADVLLELVGGRAQQVELGCPQIFDAGLAGWEQTIVNHVVFGAPVLGREDTPTPVSFSNGTVTVARPEIRLPLEAHLKTVDCVNDPNCAADDTLPLQLELSYALTADSTQICATFTHSEGLLVPQEALDQVDALAADLGPMCAPLSLGAVTGLLGEGTTIGDVALSSNPTNDRIGIRLELNTPDGAAGPTLGDWQSFLGGALADAGAEDFSLHVDQAMLRHSFEHRLTEGITCDPSDPGSDECNDEIEPDGDPASVWSWWEPSLLVGLDTDVEVPLCWDISTYLTLDVPLALSASGDAIVMDAYLDWDPNDGEIFACTLVNPIYAFTLPFPTFFGILEGIAANYSAANQISGALPSECEMVGDHGVDCTFPFALPELDLGPGPDGILSATQLRGVPTGLVLEGDVAVSGFVTTHEPLSLDGVTPYYGLHGDRCESGLGYGGWLFVEGGPGEYCPAPDSGLQSPIVVGDPLDAYSLSDVGPGPADTIDLGLGNADAAFWSDPYALVATVWTTVGSASIALDKPVEHVGYDWELFNDLILEHVMCNYTEETGLFGIPGEFDFHWLVDPPPYEMVAVGSVFDGARAVLLDASIVQTGAFVSDAATGVTILPARSATLSTTWLVDGGRYGRFEFSAESPMSVDLGGTRLFDGYALTVGLATTVTVEVPGAQIPRGARAATVSVTLEPDQVVMTGLEMR